MEQTVQKIEEILAMLRPAFQRDRGDIRFVSFNPESGVVQVRMEGMCKGCGMAEFTLKMGVEETLREQIPEITEVVAVE